MSNPKKQATLHRELDRDARRDAIIDSARTMAEVDGWDAVTTRKLAQRIDYSQPVLYGHFPGGKAEIMSAVAMQGFVELSAALRPALDYDTDDSRITAIVTEYLEFARQHPATYEAMFARPISAVFAHEDSPEPMRASFAAIAEVIGRRSPPPTDIDTAAEVLWCSTHGLATLGRDARLRAGHDGTRVRSLVHMILAMP